MKNEDLNKSYSPVMDFDLLRKTGIEYISKFSGNIWTDYNVHDPGITILEILCYAIIDIGYRMGFEIKDILTEKNRINPKYENTFYDAYKILPSSPISINDYRKLIIENIKGVKNVLLKPVEKELDIPLSVLDKQYKNYNFKTINVKGFYDVFIDLDDISEVENVKKLLDNNRNICEDFNNINILKHINVGISTNIQVEPEFNYEDILKEIIKKVSNYISPQIKFYTFNEMLEKGYTISDVFTGPLPFNGFIDKNELNNVITKDTLYISDIIKLIMQIKGVKSVKNLKFIVDNKFVNLVNFSDFKISLKDNIKHKYSFRLNLSDITNKKQDKVLNNIVFVIDKYKFLPKLNKPIDLDEENKSVLDQNLNFRFPIEKDKSVNRNFDEYYSIQNDFPKSYRVGLEGISNSSTKLDKSQRLQLKGYLLFFDQLLADFLVRLDSLKFQLSWDKSENFDEWLEYQKSLLHKLLTDLEINDIDEIIDKDNYHDYLNQIDHDDILTNKNKILNHLLARFNEDFVNFSIFQYVNIQNYENENNIFNLNEKSQYSLINSKIDYLSNIHKLRYKRAKAINYREDLILNHNLANKAWFESGNYYSIEYIIFQKLGLKDYDPLKSLAPELISKKKDGTYVFKDNRNSPYNLSLGLHVFEHNLLIPYKEINSENFLRQYKSSDTLEISPNPYSMKVTVVFPGWLKVVQSGQIRNIIERVVREEFPAHIYVKICWIDPLQMFVLEDKYKNFLKEKIYNERLINTNNNLDLVNKKIKEDALKEFVKILSNLKNTFQNISLDNASVFGENTLGYTTIYNDLSYEWGK